MPPISNFGETLGRASERMTAFADATARAVSSVSGLTDGFRGLSRTTLGLGSALAAFGGHLGKIVGLPLAAAGAAGAFAGGVASAGLGLAGAASPNGLESVNKAFDVLAGTIGTMVLPGVVALGGLALVAAGSIGSWIKEHRSDIIKFWTDAVVEATKAVQDFKKWLDKKPEEKTPLQKQKDTASIGLGAGGATILGVLGFAAAGPIGGLAGALLGGGGGAAAGQAVGGWHPPGTKGPAPGAGGVGPFAGVGWPPAAVAQEKEKAVEQENRMLANFLDKWANANDQIVKDMQQSLGRTGITDPVSKWKEVALAVQKSDLEIRKMAMFQEAISMVRDFINEMRQEAARRRQPAVAGP